MKKVLFIVGSLREGSFNSQLAKYAEKALEGQAEVSYLDYSKLPVFNQNLENPVLPEVQAVRDAVLSADVLWLFSPIYNFAIPGGVKNLLDWLSRSLDLSNLQGASALHDKYVTVSSAGNGGHDQLFGQYRQLLPFIRMKVVEPFTGARVNDSAWADGKFVLNEEKEAELKAQVQAVLDVLK